MKKIITYTVVIAIIALSAFVAKAYDGLKSSPNYSQSSYDIQFLDTMIAHHNQGMELAQIAVGKTQNKEVKSKVQARIDSLQLKISEMHAARYDIQENAPPSINLN